MPPPKKSAKKASTPQNNSSADDEPPLSQPPAGISQRQRLQWLQQRRSTGLWVKCDECGKWRYLPHVLDRHQLPAKWYCNMNPDTNVASCSVAEAPIRVRDEEDLIHSEYSAGSLVLARMAGYPWWPAMVDDCPETEQFYWLEIYSDIPTYYNVVFFDSNDMDVTRYWIARDKLKPYGPNKDKKEFKGLLKDNIYKNRLIAAAKQANDAEGMTLPKRLIKYSFVSRYRGTITKPKKIKRNVIKKFENKMKRKYNAVFKSDSGEDTDEDSEKRKPIINSSACVARESSKAIRNTIVSNKETNEMAESTNNVPTKGSLKRFKEVRKVMISKGTVDVPDSTHQLEVTIERIGGSSERKADTKIQTKSDNEILKQPCSLAVQIGSAISSAALVEKSFGTFDNDTSTTYVPDSDEEPESVYAIDKEIQKFQLQRRVSCDSDDFDFV